MLSSSELAGREWRKVSDSNARDAFASICVRDGAVRPRRQPSVIRQPHKESNPEPAVLETGALPFALCGYVFVGAARCFRDTDACAFNAALYL